MPHRYFTAEVGNGRAALNGTDAHHLADVMRAKIGENVILCDAHAVEYVGTITSIQPGRADLPGRGCHRGLRRGRRSPRGRSAGVRRYGNLYHLQK